MDIRQFFYALIPIFFVFGLFSCSNPIANVPFPEKEAEFSQPTAQKLMLTPPQDIAWKLIDLDTTRKGKAGKLRLSELPAKPLETAGFRPLIKPLAASLLNWDSLPASPFNLDTMPAKKLKFRVSILGVPKRVKASPPRLKDGATQGILYFGQDQGLPGTVGQAVAQDKDGMVWLATDNGICRYDGEFCTVYSMEEGLSQNWSYQILCDSKGKLWVQTAGGGLNVIDLKAGVIKHLSTREGLAHNWVSSIIEDSKGHIWASTPKGVHIIDEEAGTIRLLNASSGLKADAVTSIVEDDQQRIWLGIAGMGIQIIDRKSNSIKYLSAASGLPDNRIGLLKEDSNKQIWFSMDTRGAGFINFEAGLMYHLDTESGLAANSVSAITEDAEGNMWLGTDGGGVDVFNPSSKLIKNQSTKQGLSNNHVYSLLFDKAGQVWIGTNGGEFNIYNTRNIELQHFTHAQGLNNISSLYLGLAEDNQGRLWAGSYSGGVDIIDEMNRLVRHLNSSNGLRDNRVLGINKVDSGNLWVATEKGLDYVDLKEGSISHFLPDVRVHSAIEDAKRRIWIATANGIYLLNKERTQLQHTTINENETQNWTTALTLDKKGNVMAVISGGLYIIDDETETSQQINGDDYINKSNGWSLLKDRLGRIWVANNGGGVYMVDEEKKNATRFTVQNGLADNYVLSLLEKGNKIYMGTAKGLTILGHAPSGNSKGASSKWSAKSYGKPQGFLRVDFNPPALLTKSGRTWWAAVNVLTALDDREAAQNTPPSPVYISAIDIMEQSQHFVDVNGLNKMHAGTDTLWIAGSKDFYDQHQLPFDSGYQAKNNIKWDSLAGTSRLPVNLRMPYHQNHLTFHFTATHLSNVDKTRYRYILQGNDRAWSTVTENAFADYRNLAPGSYVFQVRSIDFNGQWSEASTFAFTILPPWWQTWWAYAVYALLFIFVMRTYITFRSQRLEKENKILEENITQRTAQLQKSLQDLQATQAQLVQKEKMASLGELTAGIAHEIQNPLNFVNNFSELSQELCQEVQEEVRQLSVSSGEKKNLQELVSDLSQNQKKVLLHGQRADAIVKNMLEHSRASTGEKQLTNLNALADEYLRLAYSGFRAKNKDFSCTLETAYDQSSEKAKVVPQELGRVLLNLFHNAFYAVQQKQRLSPLGYEPRVEVSTRNKDGQVEVRIGDNGTGIPESGKSKIFQPFFTTKPTGQGTGLGLSLSYDIVTKVHGGELYVESEEGKYTVFTISLPTVSPGDVNAEVQAPPQVNQTIVG